MHSATTKLTGRIARHRRIRQALSGTVERPRLAVFRSLRSISAQLIDDTRGVTLVSAHSKVDGKAGDAGERKGKQATAYRVGVALAEKATAAKITAVVFDRAGYAYHGRVQALADGARAGGLQF